MTIPVLLGVATLVFALIHLVPGDPAQAMLGEGASQEEVERLRTSLGLDQPLLGQYVAFLSGLTRGDLGTSFRYNTPVTQQITARLGNTAKLALAAMAAAILFAIPLGIIAAVFRGRPPDHVAMTLALAGISMPNFWLGPLLAILFAVYLGWLPVSGTGSLAHLVLPAVTLGAALSAILARMTRASLLEEPLSVIGWVGYARLVRGQALRAREFEFVQAARALGATSSRIVLRHVLPTAIPSVVVQATLGMAGAIIAEASLSFLGLGVQPPTPSWGTMLDAGRAHLFDAPHLTVFPGMAIALLVLGFNFLGDGLRDHVDPRMQQ